MTVSTTSFRRVVLALCGLCVASPLRADDATAADEREPSGRVSYSRDIQPILSDACFACHGRDEESRKAGLRLDVRGAALEEYDDGPAIVPGAPEESQLFLRITTKRRSKIMPPRKSKKTLSPEQIELIRRWIAEGAEFEGHWAFTPPTKPAVPELPAELQSAARNEIDRFVFDRATAEGLKPSSEADPETLARRVSLDVTGLPPTPEEVDAFLNDDSEDAYDRLVDRLLESPRYGERMAVDWLDAARYADTNGFHIDNERQMWRWREWVIDAFNDNKPYDDFTVEQIAGDLLPDATTEQKLASGFNRNHGINFEGGAIPAEYLNQYIVDRVATTGTVWLGLSTACAQCHAHKFDPISQEEYYRFYAFFNRVPENGLDGRGGNAKPFIRTPTRAQEARLTELAGEIGKLEEKLAARRAESGPAVAAWAAEQSAKPAAGTPMPAGLVAHFPLDAPAEGDADKSIRESTSGDVKGEFAGGVKRAGGKQLGALEFDGTGFVELGDSVPLDRSSAFSYGAWIYPTSRQHGAVLSRMDDGAAFRGYDLYLGDGKVFVHLISAWPADAIRVNTRAALPDKEWHHAFATYDGSGRAAGVRLYIDGQSAELEITHDSLKGSLRTAKPLRIGGRNPGALFRGRIDDVRFYERSLSGAEVGRIVGEDPIGEILRIAAADRTAEQQATLTDYWLRNHDEAFQQIGARVAEVKAERDALAKTIPTTMVMAEMAKPRDTFLLERGEYDKRGKKVTPGVPEFLPPLPEGSSGNRLGLARWLVAPEHPLTARVAVNRLWQAVFGRGIVATADDFGTQGDVPTHPQLLDWLAVRFVETGWDVKAMIRLMVTSATYRQSSRVTPEMLAADPENRLLARAPRYRLAAEMIRDQALFVSGLLVETIGGPSVKPYQPPGLWREVAYGGGNANFTATVFVQDKGEKLYRRTLYTFWKRTCPPPQLQTFDAPTRESCTVRRSRTNTPLQALILMNDPTYVEAARKLAELIQREGGKTVEERAGWAVQRAFARQARPREIEILGALWRDQVAAFRAEPDAAKALLSVGESPHDETLDVVETAAWSVVGSALLNTDEMVTKG